MMKSSVKNLLIGLGLYTTAMTVWAGAVAPTPVAAPVMGPWALAILAALVAAIAYRIKK